MFFKKIKKYSLITSLFFALPIFVFAQGFVGSVLNALSDLLEGLALIASIAAMGAFIWGVVKYVVSADNEEKRTQAKYVMVYGVVGIFVIFSIWGIVALFSNVFGIGIGGGPTWNQIPTIPGTKEAAQNSLVGKLLLQFGKWIGALVIIVMSFAVTLFFWGVAKYILSGANEEKRKEGVYYILYGVIGIFVMVAVWGFVFLLSNIFGVGIGGQLNVPSLGINNDSGISIDSQKFTGCDGISWDPKSGKTSFKGFVCLFVKLLSPLPPILITLALLYFFWGITKYIRAGGNSEELREGKNVMIYGVIAMFVMLAVWGLVVVVKNELGLGDSGYVIEKSEFDNWGDPTKLDLSNFTSPRTGN
jgi:hypothetical protein